MRSKEPRSSSSCAACKFLKRRCTPNCLFAPYFRADEPKKFAKVHKVFGASNVTKILNEVAEEQREDTVNSLVFEAEARLNDPVHGCIGAIASLQGKMFQLQHDLAVAKARLACCRSVMKPSTIHSSSTSSSSISPTCASSSSSSSSPLFLVDGEFLNAFAICHGNGMVGSLSQSSMGFDQGGSMNVLHQFPFP